MATAEQAIALAERGFWVFPTLSDGATDVDKDKKKPAVVGWQRWATRDPEKIRRKWSQGNFNIGALTGRFGDDAALVAIDVDVKGTKRGDLSLLSLQQNGFDIPKTLEHSTPTGGRHLILRSDHAMKQGVDILGDGLDIRSAGGYLVMPGSTIDGKPYQQINGYSTIAEAPRWLVEKLGQARGSNTIDLPPMEGIDHSKAWQRGQFWIENFAPIAVEGRGGDTTTYKVAAQLKDYGCDQDQTLELMAGWWNEQCEPSWSLDELAIKVRNAYRHGRDPQGILAPEASFGKVEPIEGEPKTLHPLAELNQRFAFIRGGGAFILHETTDADGNYLADYLTMGDFHAMHEHKPFQVGDQKPKPISRHWLAWRDRRERDGVVFDPSGKAGPRWFNLWRGFRVDPADDAKHPAVSAFLEHAELNVCNGDKRLFTWLMGYFAHMIQKPGEKPLVALVFKGKKGTGKNALVERVGYLLGKHFLVADDERYLTSNFNGHMEDCLAMVLDEATWAGDKKVEGKLKGVITGTQHLIERKGREVYRAKNYTRIMLLGNEAWLVPATLDERRFAVFNVGDGRIQDRRFFQNMREGMETGGYSHLLRFFLDFDLSAVDVNQAPNSQGLVDQKVASLRGPERWLKEVLTEGEIPSRIMGSAWRWEPSGVTVPKSRVYECYTDRSKRHYGEHHPASSSHFWIQFRQLCPKARHWHPQVNGAQVASVSFPPLEECRKAFEAALGGRVDWGE